MEAKQPVQDVLQAASNFQMNYFSHGCKPRIFREIAVLRPEGTILVPEEF